VTNYTEDDLRQALTDEAASTPPPLDMWTKLRRRAVVRRRVRTGVAVGAVAAAATVVLAGLPAGDDASRVSVTHGAPSTWVPNRPLSNAEFQRAVDVLRHRLDALGVGGATISTSGGGAVQVAAPGLSQSLLGDSMARGAVQFRPVFAVEAPGAAAGSAVSAVAPTLTKAEHAFGESGCPTTPTKADPPVATSSYLIACSSDGTVKYLLGPSAVDNTAIAHAQAVVDQQTNEWLVDLEFDQSGSDAFRALTAAAAQNPPLGGCTPAQGCNSIGIVVDGTVLAAPSVLQPGGIRGGSTQITGNFTRDEARALAAIAATSPLPSAFTPRA